MHAELLSNESFSLYNIKPKNMKIRIMKVSATIVFIAFLPLMLIEPIFSYMGNPVWRIKRNFQAVMYVINLGHPEK